MSEPYVGEIRLFAGSFAPAGWAFCAGQTMAIADYDVLFTLIGTTYGGNGLTTFNLPDLQGRVPIHQGQSPGASGHVLGERAGVETVILTLGQTPVHNHGLSASGAVSSGAAGPNGVLAASSVSIYGPGPPTIAMAAGLINALGGSQPHDNMAPFGVVNYIISLYGIFPSQN